MAFASKNVKVKNKIKLFGSQLFDEDMSQKDKILRTIFWSISLIFDPLSKSTLYNMIPIFVSKLPCPITNGGNYIFGPNFRFSSMTTAVFSIFKFISIYLIWRYRWHKFQKSSNKVVIDIPTILLIFIIQMIFTSSFIFRLNFDESGDSWLCNKQSKKYELEVCPIVSIPFVNNPCYDISFFKTDLIHNAITTIVYGIVLPNLLKNQNFMKKILFL